MSGILTARFGVDPDKVNDVAQCAHQYFNLFIICGITLIVTGFVVILFINKLKKAHRLAYMHQENK